MDSLEKAGLTVIVIGLIALGSAYTLYASSIAYWNWIERVHDERDTYYWMVRVDMYRKYKDHKLMSYFITVNDPIVESLSEHLGDRY